MSGLLISKIGLDSPKQSYNEARSQPIHFSPSAFESKRSEDTLEMSWAIIKKLKQENESLRNQLKVSQ